MKNNKFVSLSDFKNTLVINGFNGEMIEKAEHKVHKYLRKEGGKYIYDYDKMNVKEHEDASWEHHVQHIVNDTKAEGRKMAKDKELEEHYRKHAAYHKEEKEKHTKLAEEKKTGKKEDKTFDQQVDEHLESMKGKGVTEVHDSVMKKFKLNAKDASNQISRYLGNRNMLKKSEAFDILIPNDIDEILEKSRNEHNKPIGQTQSGKNVYHRYDHPEHKSFTKQDHTDAAQIHEDRAYLQYGKAYSKDKSGARTTGNNNRNAYGKMNYSQKQQAKHEAAAGSSENNE